MREAPGRARGVRARLSVSPDTIRASAVIGPPAVIIAAIASSYGRKPPCAAR